MFLGEWWVANPTVGAHAYEPPNAAERVPGALRELAPGDFALETIGFLGARPFLAGGPSTESGGSRPDIWGTDRDATCFSLFDNLRANTAWKPGHVSDGHEDWSVGWLAKGNAWVMPEEDCTTAWIGIDDLHRWALYRRPDNIEFDDAMETALIDLREETLCTTAIGGTNVSLVRGSAVSVNPAGQDPGDHFTFEDAVSWKVEGPVGLRAIAMEWLGHFESFSRFMTMRPSVASRVDCRLADIGRQRVEVNLVTPRLERPTQAGGQDDDQGSPLRYLTTLRTLEELGLDPMDVLDTYWRAVAAGDSYMAMALHLESQDGLLNRGLDGALLNAIRSVESLYAAHHPTVRVEKTRVQDVIDDAVDCAGGIGAQLLDAWPAVREAGVLRREVAHGKARPSASFGLRCYGTAKALQWIQRVRLLNEIGISEAAAQSIVSGNFQYPWDIRALEGWREQLRESP